VQIRAWLVVRVYVDDLIIMGESEKEVQVFKEEMKRKFRMSDLGMMLFYLGIELKQLKSGIELCQNSFADKLLERAGMKGCNLCVTPMEARLKMSKDHTSPVVNPSKYRSLIGSLRYLLHTRPDLTFSVCYLSRFMEEPRQEHLAAVKRVLRYIVGTTEFGLVYPRGSGGSMELLGYSDSDMAGDADDNKSTSGAIFFLSEGSVTWSTQKQRVVALSSCEAEYIIGSSVMCQAVWLHRLLKEMVGVKLSSPQIKVDNMSAIALSKNLVLHERSKHIKTRYHFIKECVE
jgi:hypothetical protein